MAVTTKKTFPATTNSTTDTFGPIGIELNNQDDLDVYITESGGTRVLQYKQTSASTTDSNHPQVNDTTGLYFPPVAAGVALKNYTISADNNNVIFNSDLPSGAVVSVERRTRDSSSSYTSFSGGSTIRSTDLNTAFDETRFTAQEGRNKAFDLERQTFSEDGNIRLLEDQSLVYEGATDDAYETTLAITDPTADRTITFPNVSGNVVTTGDTGTVNATMLATDSVDSDELVNGSIDTDHIANDQVTYAKIQNVSATDRILGRDSAGAGDIEEITPTALRTMLNVANGATPDQSAADIRAAVESASDSNVFTDTDHSRLNAIEDNADVTDATNVDAAGAVMNSDLDGKGELLVGDGSGDPSALAVGTNGYILTADSSEATGLKWAANAGGGGGSGASEAFKTIAVSGQNNVVADSATDTLTFAGGSNVTITTNDSTDTVTIAASGGEITVQDEGSALSTAATTLNFVGAGVTASGTGASKTITIAGAGGNTSTDFKYLELKAHNNASGAFSAGSHDYELVTKGTTTAITPAQAASLIISIGGVIQQPQPNQGDIGANGNGSDGFAIDGSSIHFGANLTAHPDFIIYLQGAGVASIADNTVTGAKIALGSDASGDIMYYNGTDYVRLAKGSDGEVLKLASGVPSWAADANTQVSIDDTPVNGVTNEAISSNWAYDHNAATGNSAHVPAAGSSGQFLKHDGTWGTPPDTTTPADDSVTGAKLSVSLVEGDVLYGSGTDTLARLAKGSAGQVLKMNSGATAPEWGAASSGTITALNNQAANRLTTIGSTTTQLDGEASLTFEDTTSTGLISGKQITGRGFECPATVADDWTIAAGNNAFFPGPMTVAANKTVTVPANRTLTIV